MIIKIYHELMKLHGPQGWWPLMSYDGTNPTKSGAVKGYHVRDYSFPRNDKERFEICIGAILTQNTTWPNVEKALLNLKEINAIDSKRILELDDDSLKKAIKPAGYFNQKAKKLRYFAEFFESQKDRTPTRKKLLSIWGIGPETADSILLYGFSVPSFVVDTYTKRIFGVLGIIDETDDYDSIKITFENALDADFKLYQEYHALIVEHAKRYYSKKGKYDDCPLQKLLLKT